MLERLNPKADTDYLSAFDRTKVSSLRKNLHQDNFLKVQLTLPKNQFAYKDVYQSDANKCCERETLSCDLLTTSSFAFNASSDVALFAISSLKRQTFKFIPFVVLSLIS